MIRRLSLTTPAFILALSIGSASRAWPLALVLALVSLSLAAIGPRLELDRGRQLLTSAIGGAAGYLLATLLHEQIRGALTEGWTRFAAATLLAATARFLIISPRGGMLPDIALVFWGLLATGKTRDPAYAVFALCFLLSSLWIFSSRGAPSTTRRRIAFGALLLAIAAGLGTSATLGLRKLHDLASGRARYTAYTWEPQVGFSENMDLGALEGLLDSDALVLRVRGARVDYLRGVTLDLYESGRWHKSDAAELETKAQLGGPLDAPGRVTITHLVRGSRFFLPLERAELVTSPASVRIDGMASVESTAKKELLVASFVPGTPEAASVQPPRKFDRMVPRRLRARLDSLARKWAAGALTPEDEVAALEQRLRTDYTYSQSFERLNGVDPLVDFLFRDRSGHCEYFASALTLLARSRGIPARMVMGYRVGERSPFGYYVVRERNAHAWVEVWLPGRGWVTRDATPAEFLPQNREHEARWLESSVDAVRVAYDEVTTFLAGLSLAETSIAWISGSLVLAWIVARGVRRRRMVRDPDAIPLPFLPPLLAELERSGYRRRADESLESLSARVADRGASELLARYVALRYGDVGDADELARDFERHVKTRRLDKASGDYPR